MTLKDPAWRQKTRPCPFFSQGRCLFSDSCNFLHDVKVRSEVDYSLTDAKLVENRVFSPPKSAFSPPSVVVNSASPRSIRVPSNNRSPRLSGLLLALQDVIGPSKESLEEDESLTDVSDTELLQVPSNDTPEHNSDITLDDSTIVADSLVDSTLPSLVHPPFTASVEVGVASDSDSEDEEEDPEPPSYILDEDSFQSEPDGQHTMIAANRPSALSAVHEAGSGRSPSGEDAQTASSLLSPIQLSARLRPFSLCSRPAREDSIDSGYADSWTGPLPFTRSPPRSALSSPASFHFGRVSLTSPLPLSRRTSYDVRAIRPSPSSYKISENEGDAEDEDEDEGEDELTFSILEAYDAFPMPPGDGVELEERDSMVSDYSSPTMRLPRDLKANTSDVIHSDPPTAEVVDETLPSNPQTTLKAILTSAMSSDDLMEETSLSGRNSIFSVGSRPSSPNTSLLSASCDDSLQSESQDEASESSLGLAYDDPSLAVDDSSSMFVSADNCGARWAMMSDVQSALERSTNRRSISISPHSDFNQEELEGCPSLASLDCDGEASESTTLSDCWPAGHGAPSDPVHEMRDTLESFSSTSRLDGPADHGTLEELNHVYDHLELANEDLSWVSDDPDKSMASTVDDSMTLPDNVSFGNDAHPVAPMQRDRATSDITIKSVSAISSALAPAESVPSSVFQRDRAASDLTVKGRSLSISSTEQGGAESPIRESSPTSAPPPMADNTCSVSGAFEGSDILQSLYDQYVDVESMDSSNILGELALQPNVMPDELSPKLGTRDLRASIDSLSNILADVDGLFSSSAPDSLQQAFNSFGLGASHFTGSLSDPPSAAAPLRPLMLTQDRHSSANFASVHSSPIQSNDYQPQQPSPPRDSASNLVARSTSRILSKEIGSTKIPFSFKRRNPQCSTRSSVLDGSQSAPAELPSRRGLQNDLRIYTDVSKSESDRCYVSAASVSSVDHFLSPGSASETSNSRLKPLRLSTALNQKPSISSPSSSISSRISIISEHIYSSSIPHSPSVSSSIPLLRNSSHSSSGSSIIPEHTRNTLTPANDASPIHRLSDHVLSIQHSQLKRDSQPLSAPITQAKSWRLSHYRAGSRNYSVADSYRRTSNRLSAHSLVLDEDEDEDLDENENENDETICRPISAQPAPEITARPISVLSIHMHAIATPKPTLLFAIASDDVEQVRKVLESGDAGPNDQVGPQSALAFALTNDNLTHKNEIVKALLAYGADPAALRDPNLNPAPHTPLADESDVASFIDHPPPATTLEGMDPATRYFVSRADAAHTRQTSQLIHRSFFRPLTRVRYDVVGQDRALEQLFRVLSTHSQRLSVTPIVVLLCGPSGHGKSLLARKFGSLLDVPTHTVNMTTLRSTHDLWQSYSMSPYEEPSSNTLAQFLLDNEGKQCVVVLDEIEKTENEKALWSLLMPWELGRCSLEAGKRHVDVRNVVWLGTSNIGHDLVFQYHESRSDPDAPMTREEYSDLTSQLRPRVSQCLGASLLSRVTTVLPFVPFSLDEKKAICAEAIYTLAGDAVRTMLPRDIELMVMKALPGYFPAEGARSLYRAVSNQLVDYV